jgi:D-alanyl-D-alanine carboxypeptidase
MRAPFAVLPFLALALFAQQPAAQQLAVQQTAAAIEAAFGKHLAAYVERQHLTGACAAFALDDGRTGAVAVGVDAARTALTTKSKLMSGSIGKTYCAAVALQLVHEKKLTLDGKVQDVLGKTDWYSRLPNGPTITLRQLLNHTSGVPEHVWKQEFQDAVTKAGDRALTPAECIAYILGDAPLAAAGSKWSYADTNYLLVGLCIEAVTGKPFYEVLRARVLTPLHLDDTIANDRRDLEGLACGMASGIGFWKGPTVADGRYFTNPAFEYCGGGISSTTRDLARWCRELFAGSVVPAELKKEQVAGVDADRRISGKYGLGCFVMESPHGTAYGHSGVMPGFLSYTLHYPELEGAVAVQFPTDDVKAVGNMKRLVDELAALTKAPAPAAAEKK